MTLKFDSEPNDPLSKSSYEGLVKFVSDSCDRGSNPRGDSYRAATRNHEFETLCRSGLFDAELYTKTYPDIIAAGVDPLLHYIQSGDRESRWPNSYFDPDFYRKQFTARGLWPVSALYHYVTYGEASGLQPCSAFDAQLYISNNPELGPWIDRPLLHFLWIGRHVGLSPNRTRRRADRTPITVTHRKPPPLETEGIVQGVNVIGPLDRVGGMGVSSRGYLEGAVASHFRSVGAVVQRREYRAQAATEPKTGWPKPIANAAINLVHMGPDTLPNMLGGPDSHYLKGRYNIAIWYWELPTLRPEWWPFLDHFHEFWAPSAFVARALTQLTTRTVRIIPPYLPHLASFNARHGASSPSPSPHFVYCFDANSVISRKNPDILLDAFLYEFSGNASARLTLKITHAGNRQVEVQHLYEVARQHENVEVIDDLFSYDDQRELIASATAYVSPHRSEGLGLTVIEAMAAGTPVIATPYGGVETFVTGATALPLAYRLVELETEHAPYPRGYVWAEPEPSSLRQALRAIVDNPETNARRAASARSLVINQFASHRVLDAVREALEQANLARRR